MLGCEHCQPDEADQPFDWVLSEVTGRSGMVDFLRKLSMHVLVGRAVRRGRETGNLFVLCRLDDSEAPLLGTSPS